MHLIDCRTFHHWAEEKGLGWEEGRVAPSFGPAHRQSPWPWPKTNGYVRPWELADLIVAAIQAAALNAEGGFYLWPPHGRWFWESDRPFYRISNALLGGIGIPAGFEGAAYFAEEEADALAAAVFARCFMIDEYEGNAQDDAFVYPDLGRLYVHFDDEEITWGMAADPEPLAAFDEGLRRLGWTWLRDRERNRWSWPLPNLA